MSKPIRSSEHRAFIRSLPCIVCAMAGRLNCRNIEACHAPGSRGMGQKRSDLDTIPMCSTHHRYQHQVGWSAFIRKYQLDIPELLKNLTERPRFEVVNFNGERRYVGYYRGGEFVCSWVGSPAGLTDSIECGKRAFREHLIDTLFRPLVEKQRAG